MTPSFAVNGSVRIAYETAGRTNGGGPGASSRPLLLVHGLGYERHGWGPVLRLLAESRRLLVFDNRGIGESDEPAGPYTVPELAGDALAVLDAAGAESADVLGVSLGGMVAQELALRAPERVGRLVLACTTPGVQGHAMPARTVRLFAEVAALPLETALRRLVENSLADTTVQERPDLVEEICDYRLAHRPAVAGWQAQAAAGARFDALARLAELRLPTLVLHGTDDHVVDVRNGELLARLIDGARLELLTGGGHLVFWEQPDRFAEAVLAFLTEEAL